MQALIYARVSMDRAEGRSVREQEEEARRVCEREGWTVARVISDSVGASRHSRGKRSGWDAVREAIAAGGVDVLVTWEASRAGRDLTGYTQLRDLCDKHGVLWSYSGRTFDLSDADDRFSTGLDALIAEKEASEISRRVRRATRANAASGRPHGRTLYGYRRLYSETTGRLDSQIPDPETAEVVRRVFADSFAGQGVGSITATLNAEGIPSPDGTVWSYRTVRRMLSNPAYAARRVHMGEVIGPADWPALIDPERFDEAQAILARRRGPRSPNATRLLTAVARCGVCQSGHIGVIGSPTRTRKYECRENHCVARDADALDRYVSALLVARISQIDDLGTPPASDEVDDLRDQIAILEARWDALADLTAKGELSVRMLVRQEQAINADLARLHDQLRRLIVPQHLELPTGDVGEWWEALPPARRREYVGALIDVLVINRTRRGTRTFYPDDVEVVWR